MPFTPQNNTVILFVKLPRLGQVKTRLAKDIGMFLACQVYRMLMRQTIRCLIRSCFWRTLIAITPPYTQWYTWLSLRYRVHQGYGDLGKRIVSCLRSFARPNVIVIGSDTVGLTPNKVLDLFKLLRSHRFVFGPSFDGGYWGIGWRCGVWSMNALRYVRWSTPYALEDSVKSIHSHMRIGYGIALQDVDTYDDLQKIRGLTRLPK